MRPNQYLRKRSGVWYADFTIPAMADEPGPARIRLSLGTGDDIEARGIRDRLVVPLIREAREQDVLRRLVHDIAASSERLRANLDSLMHEADLRLSMVDSSRGSAGPTLRELADRYITHLGTGSNLAPGTIRKHDAMLNAVCAILGGDYPANEVSTDHIRAFRDGMLAMPVGWQKMTPDNLVAARSAEDTRTLSKRSVQDEIQRLRVFWRWCIDEELVRFREVPGAGIKVEMRGHKRTAKECPTVEQADALLALPCPDTMNPEAWDALPRLARYTGCRIGELAMLNAEDVLDSHGVRCLRLYGDHLKTESSMRLVPVSDRAAPTVDRLLAAHPSGRLLPDCGDWTDKNGVLKAGHYFLKSWNRHAKQVGPFSFHCWRVYANIRMYEGNIDRIDRERILGHQNRETQAAYMPRDLGRYKQALDLIP